MESENSSDIDIGFDNGKQLVGKGVTFGDMPRPSKTITKNCRESFINPEKREKVTIRQLNPSPLVHSDGLGPDHGKKANYEDPPEQGG